MAIVVGASTPRAMGGVGGSLALVSGGTPGGSRSGGGSSGAHGTVPVEELLSHHLDSLRRKRGALAWAFFPDGNSHLIEGEVGHNAGSRYVVCAACHPGGLPLTAATSLCGGKQTGVFRYHWRTGQRSITDHVNKKHEELLGQLATAKAEYVAVHGEDTLPSSGAGGGEDGGGEGSGAGGGTPGGGGGMATPGAQKRMRAAGGVSVIPSLPGLPGHPAPTPGAVAAYNLMSSGFGGGAGGAAAAAVVAAAIAASGSAIAADGSGVAKRPRPHRPEQPFIIDLRSDTVTKPTDAMRRAMAEAAVGDDVFGDDPTVQLLEAEMCAVFNKEAAVFVPSGTMGNLISVGVHCEVRGSEFICGSLSHIHIYEQGGAASLMGAHPRPVPNKNDGTIDLDDIRGVIRADDQHFPTTRLLCVEQTHNKCGGRVLPLEYLDKCGQLCKENGIKLHLDGARIWNAAAALGVSPARCVAAADTVSVCLSKGLGAPVGSVILGDAEFIRRARRLRKACGGTMRQAGVLAAAALMALKEIHPVIHLDHLRMTELATGLGKIDGLKVGRPVQSNICFLNFAKEIDVPGVLAELRKRNIVVIPWQPNQVRLVTHHEINQAAVQAVLKAFSDIVGGVYTPPPPVVVVAAPDKEAAAAPPTNAPTNVAVAADKDAIAA